MTVRYENGHFRNMVSRGSSVSIVTRLQDGHRNSTAGRRKYAIFILRKREQTASGGHPDSCRMIACIKRSGREADHSSPSNAEVKNELSYTSRFPYVFMAWYLLKHKNKSTFTLLNNARVWLGLNWLRTGPSGKLL
jgi:hypothetical protein